MVVCALAGCKSAPPSIRPDAPILQVSQTSSRALTTAEKIVASAVEQYKAGATYDASYVKLSYPGGDVPADRGACSDVVIRAYRAVGLDLQQLIHEDIKSNWSLYPRYKGLDKPDPNIDHRRVKNFRVFFGRFGLTLGTDLSSMEGWKPGDIITWDLGGGKDHVGIVTGEKAASGNYLVIHNIGGVHFDDSMGAFQKVTGHYRYPKPSR